MTTADISNLDPALRDCDISELGYIPETDEWELIEVLKSQGYELKCGTENDWSLPQSSFFDGDRIIKS